MRRSRTFSADLSAKARPDPTRHPRSLPAGIDVSSYNEVSVRLSPAAADLASTLLFELGATAIVVTEKPRPRLRTHLPDDETFGAKLERLRRYLAALQSMGLDAGSPEVVARRVHDPGWALRWKKFFKPLRIGKRLVVKPSWEPLEPRAGDVVLELDPGMAFGTGQHPTTRICLEFLEEAFNQFRVQSSEFRDGRSRLSGRDLNTMNDGLRTMNRRPAVLDLGTGSGLLGIAAFRLGASAVLALDTDGTACRIACENVRRNGGDGRVLVKQGSLDAAGRRTFDMILANLTAEQLTRMAPRIAKTLRSGGRLIVSGLLADQERRVAAALRRCGLVPVRVRRRRGWAGLMYRRAVASPHAGR